MPPSLSVELTNHCNLHCRECPSGSGAMKRARGYMDISLFRSLVSELGPYLFNLNLYFQGEPMLHPSWQDFITAAGKIPATLSTNGHYLDREISRFIASSGLRRLIISIDGADQETYSAYRIGGDLSRVLEGIKNISGEAKALKSRLKISLQMLVNRFNQDQVSEIRKTAKKFHADLVLKSMQFYSAGTATAWMPDGNSYRRYDTADGKLKIRSNLPRRCSRLWFNPVVSWDGMVLPCCFDKDVNHRMGDLGVNSFREIWHGENFRSSRNSVLNGREKTGMCCNCTAGLIGIKT